MSKCTTVKNNEVYASADLSINIIQSRYERDFFTIRLTLHKNLTSESIAIIFESVKACLLNSDGRMYIELDVVKCELLSLNQLEIIGRNLSSLRPLLMEKLVASFIKCSDDTYNCRGIYGSLVTFFQTLYKPVRPYDFFFTDEDRSALYHKYEHA